MRAQEGGSRPPEKREGRDRLSPRDPLVETLLNGLGFEGQQLAETRRFCKRTVSERNRWSIQNRGGPLAEGRKLSKDDAPRALAIALARAIERGEL